MCIWQHDKCQLHQSPLPIKPHKTDLNNKIIFAWNSKRKHAQLVSLCVSVSVYLSAVGPTWWFLSLWDYNIVSHFFFLFSYLALQLYSNWHLNLFHSYDLLRLKISICLHGHMSMLFWKKNRPQCAVWVCAFIKETNEVNTHTRLNHRFGC